MVVGIPELKVPVLDPFKSKKPINIDVEDKKASVHGNFTDILVKGKHYDIYYYYQNHLYFFFIIRSISVISKGGGDIELRNFFLLWIGTAYVFHRIQANYLIRLFPVYSEEK